jgi:tetratricopeptide (TPR) repeat protein
MTEVMKLVAFGCPELETIAAYLDGRLSNGERARVTEHLADCETCYFVTAEATQMWATDAAVINEKANIEQRQTEWWRRLPASKKAWSSAAVLVTAASFLLAVGTGMIPLAGDSSGLRALVAAVGTDRIFEPRLSGGFVYGPVRGPVRGVDGSPASPDVRIAVASIEKEAARRRTPQHLHELGIAYLVTGDMPRAIVTLEDAVNHTNAARTASDLAAAYLVRGVRENRPQDMSRALALASVAARCDTAMGEALFNRAFALEHLSMFDDARQAWQAYLKVDDQSGWAAEARIHLQRLAGEQRTP